MKVADAGKYMVKAVNAAGEAQSIADFAVLEPTPDRMVEVVKTVVFDHVQNQQVQMTYLCIIFSRSIITEFYFPIIYIYCPSIIVDCRFARTFAHFNRS